MNCPDVEEPVGIYPAQKARHHASQRYAYPQNRSWQMGLLQQPGRREILCPGPLPVNVSPAEREPGRTGDIPRAVLHSRAVIGPTASGVWVLR